MRPPDPEQLARLHVPGAGTPDIRRLHDGLSNQTYRVLRDGRAYALRLAGNSAPRGTEPDWECRVVALAARNALAPPVYFCDPAAGVLVSGWVKGSPFGLRDAADAGIARMVSLMRRIHGLPPPQPPRAVTPAAWVDYYAGLLAAEDRDPDTGVGLGGRAAGEVRRLRAAAAERLEVLAALPAVQQVLCHGDLHPLNLVDAGGRLVVLDWEYSHVTDPYWDLAALSSANDWGAEPRRKLLSAYGGTDPTPEECVRFDVLAWLYDYVCLAWGAVHTSSPADRARQLATRLDEYPVVASAKFRHTTRGSILGSSRGNNGDINGADDGGGSRR